MRYLDALKTYLREDYGVSIPIDIGGPGTVRKERS